jgi:hypothetical protein
MFAVTLTSKMESPGGMTIVETATTAFVIGTGTLFVAVGITVVAGAAGRVARFNDQLLNIPPSWLASSLMVRVQTPLGFSPMNAARASSGASSGTVTRSA